jgi:hypothetical protein
MVHMAKEFGLATPELILPVKKLLADGKLRAEGAEAGHRVLSGWKRKSGGGEKRYSSQDQRR